jgi:hypothetical protein
VGVALTGTGVGVALAGAAVALGAGVEAGGAELGTPADFGGDPEQPTRRSTVRNGARLRIQQ